MSKITMDAGALAHFKKFCEDCGWVEVPTSGEWEVLRMRHAMHDHPMMIHRRKRPELGLTLHGESARLYNNWLALYGEW